MSRVFVNLVFCLTIVALMMLAQESVYGEAMIVADSTSMFLTADNVYESNCLCSKLSLITDPGSFPIFEDCVKRAESDRAFKLWLVQSLENSGVSLFDCIKGSYYYGRERKASFEESASLPLSNGLSSEREEPQFDGKIDPIAVQNSVEFMHCGGWETRVIQEERGKWRNQNQPRSELQRLAVSVARTVKRGHEDTLLVDQNNADEKSCRGYAGNLGDSEISVTKKESRCRPHCLRSNEETDRASRCITADILPHRCCPCAAGAIQREEPRKASPENHTGRF